MLGRFIKSKRFAEWSRRSEFFGWLRAAQELRWVLSEGGQAIFLAYRVRPHPRWGYGAPAHPQLAALLEAGRGRFSGLVDAIESLAPGLRAIPVTGPPGGEPVWDNDFCRGLNAASLYAFPKLFGSRRYLEVGSGHSTRFVRRGIRDHGLGMVITSIDPHPRAEVDALCDEVIRQPLEDVAPSVVDRLEANDILMVDNSHRCFQNSDVTVVFLELLPRLKPGVLVYIDDIYLPLDYPPDWGERYYSEQYLLAVLLMADAGRRYEVLLPCTFMAADPLLRTRVDALWDRVGIGHQGYGNGIWLRVRDAGEAAAG
jgi:hypothetical protein